MDFHSSITYDQIKLLFYTIILIMALVIPNNGEQHLLKLILSIVRPANLYIHLYSNDLDLSSGNFIISDFLRGDQIINDENDIIDVINNYSPIILNPNEWTISTVDGITTAQHTPVTFELTTNEVPNIYGYYISSSGDPAFSYTDPYEMVIPDAPIFAERFSAAPLVIPPVGSTITVVPKIRLSSL